ncbi:MAG: hypothetical protein ABR985_00595 [Methanotrichaceae archaeon]
MRTKPLPPPDYSDEDTKPANVVHQDDRPCNKIAAAAWDRRIANGELLVVDRPGDSHVRQPVNGGERPDEPKRISST